MNLRNKLITLSVLMQGNWKKMCDVLTKDIALNQITDEQVENAMRKIQDVGVMTILDDAYPDYLKEINSPPFVLYYRGDLTLLKQPKVGVMGNRRPSKVGLKACQTFIRPLLQQDVVIVGNLQLGIDTLAHLLAIKEGRTIAVLSSGFSHVYPTENASLCQQIAKEGLVLSEYPSFVYPNASQFYRSHYLVEELSGVMFVIELVKEDKRVNIARQLLDEGKMLYALPAPYDTSHATGNLELIQHGAYCVTQYQQLIEGL